MIDFSLLTLVPSNADHKEFCYQVKKAAMGGYIEQIWGWNETFQKELHNQDWQQKQPQIILHDNQPIGTIFISQDENQLEIERFYLLPEYQNKGIGTYLLQQILEKSDKALVPTRLSVLKINPAKTLYERYGFVTIKEDELMLFMERKLERKYKAVIFDLFGTLVDNFTNTEYQQVLDDMSSVLIVPPDKFSKLWRDSFYLRTNGTHRTHEESIRYICRELDVPVTDKQVERAAAMRLDYTEKTLVPRPEAIAVINKLKSSGYKVGLISDCSPETPAVWAGTPFSDIFDVTIFSCVVCLKKPDPRIYQLACDRLGVEPKDCLYIGDGSSYELTGALNVGMHPVLIRNPNETADTHFVDREGNWKGTWISSLKEVLTLVSS